MCFRVFTDPCRGAPEGSAGVDDGESRAARRRRQRPARAVLGARRVHEMHARIAVCQRRGVGVSVADVGPEQDMPRPAG